MGRIEVFMDFWSSFIIMFTTILGFSLNGLPYAQLSLVHPYWHL